jgi:hypothetical protein
MGLLGDNEAAEGTYSYNLKFKFMDSITYGLAYNNKRIDIKDTNKMMFLPSFYDE